MKANWKTIKNKQDTFNISIKQITNGQNYKSFIWWRKKTLATSFVILAIAIAISSFWLSYYKQIYYADIQLSWLLDIKQDSANEISEEEILAEEIDKISEEEVLAEEEIDEISEEEILAEEIDKISEEEVLAEEEIDEISEEEILAEEIIDDTAFEVILNENELAQEENEEVIEANQDIENIDTQSLENQILEEEEIINFFEEEDQWENVIDSLFWDWNQETTQEESIIQTTIDSLKETLLWWQSAFRINTHIVDPYTISNIEKINNDKYWSLDNNNTDQEFQLMHWSDYIESEKIETITEEVYNHTDQIIHNSAPAKENLSFTWPSFIIFLNSVFAILLSIIFFRLKKVS